MLMTRTR